MDLNPYGSLGFLSTLVPLSLATIGVASSPALRSPSLVHCFTRVATVRECSERKCYGTGRAHVGLA